MIHHTLKSDLLKNDTPNFTRQSDDAPAAARHAAHAWFDRARFGMFVHFGLYSVRACQEWQMFTERIPRETYNQAAEQFRVEKFDAAKMVALAKRAGAGYVVMGARHHEGFCLWDSATTNFTTAKTAAGRDLVREYTTACRAAGLRVGIYFSIMSWQWPAFFDGPEKNPRGWAQMVAETREQLRELLSNYGAIDLLFYDGCMVPGVSDRKLMARLWHSRELNALARKLQPNIIINDRSELPEDYSTPEQSLTLPPQGRRWEMNMTMGDAWGWRPNQGRRKSAATLIDILVTCARYGGNLLLNIGPKPDGSIPRWQSARMEAIGRWMKINGEAVRDSQRTPYTESDHLAGVVTSSGAKLYVHFAKPPANIVRLAGLRAPVLSARVLGSGRTLAVEQFADGTACLRGLAALPFSAPVYPVVALEFAGAAPQEPPPSLLLEKDTGIYAPAEEPVRARHAASRAVHHLAAVTQVAGRFVFEAEVISSHPRRLLVTLNDSEPVGHWTLSCADYADTLRSKKITLPAGRHQLRVAAVDHAPFGVTGWRLAPVWQPVPAWCWEAAGAYPTPTYDAGAGEGVKAAMQTVFPPELSDSAAVSWRRAAGTEPRVDFTGGQLVSGSGVCYGRLAINSPVAQTVAVQLGCDWWANLLLNGSVITGNRQLAAVTHDGAWFSGWKPRPALLPLTQGRNILLVKCHQGRQGNWFQLFINNPGNLKFGG